MVEAAVAEADGYPETSVLVSAALAGWVGDSELKGVGIFDTPGSQVSRMTKLALKSGAEGILFPARELGVVVQVCRPEASCRMGNSRVLWRVADTTGCLSSSEHMTEADDIVAGGAHRVIIPQVRVEGYRGK